MKFNVNDNVRFRLTNTGRKILAGTEHRNWESEKVDKDGYISTQLWYLMHIFGSHLALGKEPPFETIIILEVTP